MNNMKRLILGIGVVSQNLADVSSFLGFRLICHVNPARTHLHQLSFFNNQGRLPTVTIGVLMCGKHTDHLENLKILTRFFTIVHVRS